MKKIILLLIPTLFLLTACTTKTEEKSAIEYEVYEKDSESRFVNEKGSVILQITNDELTEIILSLSTSMLDSVIETVYKIDSLDATSFKETVKPELEVELYEQFNEIENLILSNIEVRTEGTSSIKEVIQHVEAVQSVKPDTKLLIRDRKAEKEKDSTKAIYPQ